MKSFTDMEDKIFDSGEIIKRAGQSAISNMSKIIAFIAAAVMTAVTFTDITFTGLFTESFYGSIILLLITSYIIYFSLEDAGERSGAETEEYKAAHEKYVSARDAIKGDDIDALRRFCEEYSMKECEGRRRSILIGAGLSPDLLERFRRGAERFDKRTERILKRAERIRREPLTPKTLLSRYAVWTRSELENPEKKKIPILVLKLIPSTICMTITVSVMLSAKDGLTPSDILGGILKLSALPLVGFKGFSAGYSYSKHKCALWLETKANILEAFIKGR